MCIRDRSRKSLETIVPILCATIFLLCFLSAVFDVKGKPPVNLLGLFSGFGAYFFAKGIFCSVSLYIAAKTLWVLIDIRQELRNDRENSGHVG